VAASCRALPRRLPLLRVLFAVAPLAFTLRRQSRYAAAGMARLCSATCDAPVNDFRMRTPARSSPAIPERDGSWLFPSVKSGFRQPHLRSDREALRDLPRAVRKRGREAT
jgi:hypothetical protein